MKIQNLHIAPGLPFYDCKVAVMAMLALAFSCLLQVTRPTTMHPKFNPLQRAISIDLSPMYFNLGSLSAPFNEPMQKLEVSVSSLTSSIQNPAKAAHTLLARITAYSGGDRWSRNKISATGVTLHPGVCAVDPKVIPYFATVDIPQIGTFKAVDTGTAVVNRKAARLAATNNDEKKAIVIDIYFPTEKEAEAFSRQAPAYVPITWYN